MAFSSITRISGINSGMDTDTLVKKLMTAESASYNKMKQNQQKLQWQSDAYRQWNTDVFTYKTQTLFNATLSSTFGTFGISSSSDASVSGAATGDAIPGTHTFEVNQLAQAATISGNPTIGLTDKIITDGSKQTFKVTLADGRSQTINIGDGADANTINDLVSKINTLTDSNGKSMGLQGFYDSTLNKFIVRTKDTGAATSLSIDQNTSNTIMSKLGIASTAANIQIASWTNPSQTFTASSTFTINGKNFNVNVGDKITDLVKAINKDTDPNDTLQAAYNSTNGQITISTSKGSTVTIQQQPPTGLVFASAPAYFAVGKDAKVKVDATDYVSNASNTANIYGVNYTFKSADPNTTVTVSTTRDFDAEVKNIKDFISKYNDMNDKVYNALNEPVYKDYQPLTDDQRTAMSETQITQWETKAKSGLLHSDSILSTLYNSMRSATSAVVNTGSQYNTLASIGIESTSYLDHGKLTVDDTKLRAALQADPDGVKALFTQVDSKDATKNGIINQLSNGFQQAYTDLTTKAGRPGNSQNDQSTIGKGLQDIATRILNEQTRLTNVENAYYDKFSKMETAMGQYNSQSTALMQQLGMGGTGH